MKIPQSNFGNVIAEPQRQAIQPRDSQVADAAINLGNAGKQLAQQLQASEEAKKRAGAASSTATMTNEFHDAYGEYERDVSTGKIKSDEALGNFQKRLADIKKARTEGMATDQLQAVEPHLIAVSGKLERNLKGVIIKRNDAETDANVMGVGEQLQRAAMRDLPGSVERWNAVVDATPWDPTKKAQQKQLFVEGATYNFANATLEGAAQTGNIDLVRAAREKIEGAEGEPIDPARRTALITKAYAFENGIIASGVRDAEKAKREQEARENKGRDAYKDAQELMLNGRYFSTEYMTELIDKTQGTSAAPAVQELVKSQAEVAGFASLPLSQQTAILEQRRATGSTKGIGTSPDQERMTNFMEKIRDGGQKAYAENPWTAAQERGVIPRAPEVSMSNLQEAQTVLAQRMSQIETVEAGAERKVSPFQPDEAASIGRLVRLLPPDQQSTALVSISTMIGDGDRLIDFARQIDTRDKNLATLMMIGDIKTTRGRQVLDLAIKGERALQDKTITVDNIKETGWRGAIAKELEGAYRNREVEVRMAEAAYLVQAGFAAEGSGTDTSRAVRMVAGRIVQHNGGKIPLPLGMEENDFEKRIKAIKPENLTAQAPGGVLRVGKTEVPVEQFIKSLPDAALEHAGQGRYVVKASMGYVTNQAGKKIVIEVRHAN